MPSEGMTTNTHVMTLCKVHETITIIVTEAALIRFNGIKLHLVLANHHVIFLGNEG